jgi:glycosyltransferase involved in cell wall biosynthesis
MQPALEQPLKYSVVIPVFNEEGNIPEIYRRVVAVMEGLDGPFELVFVNDGSRDRSFEIMFSLHEKDPRVKILDFSRNFGHQIAITAGLDHANGEAVIIMDADLQDPPEIIPRLVESWKSGSEVIYAVRVRRKGEGLFKLWTASAFYRLLRLLSNIEIPMDAGDFRLLDKEVVKALRDIRERHRFVRGLISWVGFKQTSVTYEREERFAGETKYSVWKMMKFAMDGITSFSHLPLRLVTMLGFFCFALSFGVGCWALYVKIFTNSAIQGWTSLIGVILFLGGVQLLALGIIGEYLASVFDEVKNRPIYILRKTHGL